VQIPTEHFYKDVFCEEGGFICGNWFRSAFGHHASLSFQNLRPQKRNGHCGKRNDFLEQSGGKSGAAYFKRTRQSFIKWNFAC